MARGLTWIGLGALLLTGTTCVWPRTFTIVERIQLADLRAETAALQGRSCVPERVARGPTTSAPAPPRAGAADASFAGDIHGMRVHVTLHEGGSYDYVETWSGGLAPWWELVPIGSDWKVGCRIHGCELPGGRRCCWQECRDGGDRGLAYEGPDRFSCMNAATGAIFQWFLDGLAASGVEGLEGCAAEPTELGERPGGRGRSTPPGGYATVTVPPRPVPEGAP